MEKKDYITFKGEPNDDSEVNSIVIDINKFPQLAKLKMEELAELGLDAKEIETFMKDCKIELELFYHKGSGLFGVESGAVESCEYGGLFSPYDGKTELRSEESLEEPDEENEFNGDVVREVDTLGYGIVCLVARFDVDEGNFYDMYEKDGGGYLGELHTENLEALTDKDIENIIDEDMGIGW